MRPYDKLKGFNELWRSWSHVKSSGLKSKSRDIRNETQEFDFNSPTKIKSISSKLSHRTFEFEAETGIKKSKPGKCGFRPIVMGPMVNRLVRRSILTTLQENEQIKAILETPHSFGGIKGKGVRTAVLRANEIVKSGSLYFLASDISNFFTSIPKEIVEKKLAGIVPDDDFNDLFRRSLVTELANMAQLRGDAQRFPIHDIGVAQGNCLSALVGNILLEEFDKQLNTKDVFCLRYIDDFILLGPSEKIVKAKFGEAIRILGDLGLSAYRPEPGSKKASCGLTKSGFKYLGCDLHEKIRPSRDAWLDLKESLEDLFKDSLTKMSNPTNAIFRRASFTSTLNQASLIVRSWGNQYAFCSDRKYFRDIDAHLDDMFMEYEKAYLLKRSAVRNTQDRRRIAGFFCLADCKDASKS